MPYVLSFFCGAIASAIMGALTPLVMIAEMGGPIDFRLFVLVPIAPTLLLAMSISKVTGILHGSLCGIAFSYPIGLASLVISAFVSSYELNHHEGELPFVAIATLILSVIVIGLRAFFRDAPTPSAPGDDTAA